MYPFKSLLLAVSASILLFSCAEPDIKQDNGFRLSFDGANSTVKANGEIEVSLGNLKGTTVDSVAYFLDDIRVASSKDGNATISIPDGRVGRRTVLARVFSGDQRFAAQTKLTVVAPNAPKTYTYEILETYPHDQEAFTQGMEFKGDTLYESTGQYYQSTLRKVDYTTGEVLNTVSLENNQFGEGLTIYNDKIYQLTWKNNIGLIYDAADMEKEGSFNYGQSAEGWGLCNDGERFYKSDGTSRIWILDPETMEEVDYIEVYTNDSMIEKINELEFINGKIYANVWQFNGIAIIDPATGIVEGQINTASLKNEVSRANDDNVLNGIAYKGEENILYLTGKRWEKLFKILVKDPS